VIGNESVLSFFNIFSGEPYSGKNACFNSTMKDWTLNGGTLLKVGEVRQWF